MGRKNKKNTDDGSISFGGLGDFAGWPDIAEDEEEEDEEEEEEEEEDLPPPPPPPPAGKGKGKGGKNQPQHNAAKGAQQQQRNQKQNQNQNQQWNHHEDNQRERQQQQFATNDWGAPKRNGQMPNHPNQNQGNRKNNNNNNTNNNNNNGKNNRNNKKQSRIEEVEEEEEVPAWGSVAGDWYNGAPGEAASGVGFMPGTGTGTGVGPGSMAGWPGHQPSVAANSDWGGGAPQQSFRRQQDQLASLLHHPRVWTPSVGISDDVRSQLHASAPYSAHSHPPGGPPSAAKQSTSANSRTFRHAAGLTSASILNGGAARNGPHTQVQILDSGGTALKAADKALFGHDRLSSQRVYWMFSPYKDLRVSVLLEWVQAMNHALATVGVHHLLQTQQRGALFTNADFRHWQFTNEPTFDWLTFDDIVDTYDKTLQESIAFYEVENQVLVFIFLLSPSKSSMAVWRRKIVIPNAVRAQNRTELTKIAKSLSKRKFVLTVDNLPKNSASPPEPPKPKRKWFNILG